MKMKFINFTILICFLFVNLIFALDKTKDCKCRILPKKRIVGGKIADRLSFPWQITISFKDPFPIADQIKKIIPNDYKVQRHSCGGSILNERWILTAGHCIPEGAKTEIDKMLIGYGLNDLVKLYDKNQYVEIEKAIVHPDFLYGKTEVFNDIALIKLKTPLKFNDTINPACLLDESHTKLFYNGALQISGWGSIVAIKFNQLTGIGQYPIISRFLKEAEVYDSSHFVPMCSGKAEKLICVSNEKTNEGACKGDSGGPLHYTQSKGKSAVIGLTSYAQVTSEDFFTEVLCDGTVAYARVNYHLNFIKRHINYDYCSI